jgi:hypothetical protein
MVENTSFALGMFEREQERKLAERANRRLTDMFAALSSTNTAIVRARSADEMFRLVCESVAKGGRSLGAAAIFRAEPNSKWLKMAAASGELVDLIEKMPLSIDPADPHGQGLHGPAFREQKIQICGDTSEDPRSKLWNVPGAAKHGCSVVPLVQNGHSVGVMFFFFKPIAKLDEKVSQLMVDIAENVSFGLEMFEREQQKVPTKQSCGHVLVMNCMQWYAKLQCWAAGSHRLLSRYIRRTAASCGLSPARAPTAIGSLIHSFRSIRNILLGRA